MRNRVQSIALLWVLLFTLPVSARDLVIDNVGGSDYQNDRGLVGGPATYGPYRTIMRALLVAQRGDSIVLTKNDEPYRECIALNGPQHSGYPWQPFRIIGNGAVLDGSTWTNPVAWQREGGDVYRYTLSRPGFGQLMRGGRSLPQFRNPVGNLIEMPLGHWAFHRGNLYFRPEAGTSPADHPLEITTETVGITLYDVENVIISDLTVRGYRIDGINAHDKANEVQLVGIAARHNGRSGFSVGGSSSVTIGACLSERNGQSQLRTEGTSHTYLANVDFVAGSAPAVERDGGTVANLPKP